MYSGILIVDKPADFTSFDVVAKMRGIAHQKKIGHGGTLDPMATGVLPLFLGASTRIVDLLPNTKKRYTATAQFGIKTDTGDITGDVIEKSATMPEKAQLLGGAAAFLGGSAQLPPMYSAVRVNGKRLYELARKGEQAERVPRPITIYEIELVNYSAAEKQAVFDVVCSKGTYIRTLVEDIAARCGALATVAALRRTESAGFTLEQSHTLEQIERAAKNDELGALVLAADAPFSDYPEIVLGDAAAARYRNGAPVFGAALPDGLARVYGTAGFLGLGRAEQQTLYTFKQLV